MMSTFDANILVYAYDDEAGPKQKFADELLRRAARRNVIFTLQTLGEFFFAATRRERVTVERARAAIERIRKAFPVIAADQECLDHALDARQHHLIPFWDALFWATAQKAGCSLIFSEDFQDCRQLGGVLIVNPFNPENRVLLDAALPPVE